MSAPYTIGAWALGMLLLWVGILHSNWVLEMLGWGTFLVIATVAALNAVVDLALRKYPLD